MNNNGGRAETDAQVEKLARAQAGLVARRQLNELAFDRFRVRNQLRARRWLERSDLVLSTFTGDLTREQTMWLGVLHAGGPALVGGLTAGELVGLRNWHRDMVTVLVPRNVDVAPVDGVRFVHTRRNLRRMRRTSSDLPACKVEPALLLWAGYSAAHRAAQGVLAAAVQQRVTTPTDLTYWVGRMRPLRRARLFRQVLADIEGGSQSLSEIDVLRMCRRARIARPRRQTKRRDSAGQIRWTDCEWTLPNGHLVVLEVDGAFHMDVEHWEDDLARQRRISSPDRTVVRCTSRELRDDSDQLGRDLIALGVPVVPVDVRYRAL